MPPSRVRRSPSPVIPPPPQPQPDLVKEMETRLEARIAALEVEVKCLKDTINSSLETVAHTLSTLFEQDVTLNNKVVSVGIRSEALIRFITTEAGLTDLDGFICFLAGYMSFYSYSQELRSIPSIPERISKAKQYNEASSGFRFMADDLDLLQQINDSGGTSPETIEQILSLPHTEHFKQSLTSITATSNLLTTTTQ